MLSETVLLAEGLHHEFDIGTRQRKVIIENLNLELHDGEVLAVVGPSGCGKTTLLRILAGLIVPTAGQIKISETTEHARPQVRVVFQEDRLLPWRSAADNIRIGLQAVKDISKQEAERLIDEVLELVGLTPYRDFKPRQLSGGMRQRVNLARALVARPRMLLMDEPLSSLDAQIREAMQEELLKIVAATGVAVIFITHQIDEAIYLADRVVVLTAPPSSIAGMVSCENIPRPRLLPVKRTVPFNQLENDVYELLTKDHPLGA